MDRETLMLECLKLANTNARDHLTNIEIAKAYAQTITVYAASFETAGKAETPRPPKSNADSKR
jgi:hypothetical protein